MKKGKIFFNITSNQLYTWASERKHIILLVTLLVLVYWKWWIGGVRAATDFPAVSMSDLKIQLDLPRVWFSRGSMGFGGYSVFTLWSWPMDFIAGALSNFGLTFQILEKIMFIIPTLLIGVYSIWSLLKDFELSKSSKLIATFFYLTNTYILLLIDGGQLSIGLAYAFFPTCYLLFIKAVKGMLKDKIIAGLALFVLGMFDIRFLYILAILLTVRFVFFGRTVNWIKTAMITLAIFVGLNFYWILPLVKFPLSSQIFSNLTQTSNLNFTQFKNSVSLLQPHWYENIFGKIHPFRKEFLLIPLLAFVAPILKRKNKEVWFWAFVALLSVFLAKGANTPFPNVYPWLFSHLPGFSLFRDSTKFFFLIGLSYSVLISFTVEIVSNIFSKLKFVLPTLIAIYLIYLVRPVYLGQMTGAFSEPRYEKEYSILSGKLEDDQAFGKILWIPLRTPLGFASRNHGSVEASSLESMRPFVINTVGTYETQNFIREGSYIGQLFDILGIKYISYPYFDIKRDNTSKEKVDYYNVFISQIANLPWIDKKISDSPVPMFVTKRNQDKFYMSENTFFITGSDSIYQKINDLGGIFSDNALAFTEEFPQTAVLINKVPNSKAILYGKEKLDLIMSFVSKDLLIFPSKTLSTDPKRIDNSGWWKRDSNAFLWWRNFLQTKYGIDNLDFDYGGGWSIAEGESELTLKNSQFKAGNILLARVMKDSKGGVLEFFQGGMKIGEIDTKIINPKKVKINLTGHDSVPDKTFTYDQADFNWVNVGKLVSNENIQIKSHGEINVVNSLVSIDKNTFQDLTGNVESLYKDGKIIEWNNLNDIQKQKLFSTSTSVKVSYDEISPTHYKVKIRGLTAPGTLAFSDTFNPLWNLDGKESYRLYSLINGFSIVKDGDYDIWFKPQESVYLGLVVSVISLVASIIIILRSPKKPIQKLV